MVKWLRLDERMIHGQIVTKWSRTLGVNRIIVADDTAATNEIVKKSLMMAAPTDCKVAIVTVDKAIALCTDPRAEALHILVIVSTPENLEKIVQAVPGIPQVNVGNYGRIVARRGDEPRKMYSNNLFAYDDEVALLRRIIATGVPCNVQTIPDDIPQDLAKVLG